MSDKNHYDLLEYDSYPFEETAPQRLEALGLLYGLEPPSSDTARILEIGCGAGGNLIPMASYFPKRTCLGIDMSESAISKGLKLVGELGLENIRLVNADICDYNDRESRFDYIVIHGVFSWVGVDVQEAILRIVSNTLALNGLAYISYNRLPGWYLKQPLMDYLRTQVDEGQDPQGAVEQARLSLVRLEKSLEGSEFSADKLVLEQITALGELPPWYLYHEYLAPREPMPLTAEKFEQKLAVRNLAYLTEANLSRDCHFVDGSVSETISEMFSKTFSKSILGHREFIADAKLESENFFALRVASKFKLDEASGISDQAKLKLFHLGENQTQKVIDPLLGSALSELEQIFPENILFTDLCEKLGVSSFLEKKTLASGLLTMIPSGGVLLEKSPVESVRTASKKPKVSSFNRVEVFQHNRITTSRNTYVVLDNLTRVLVALLDGDSNRSAICEMMRDIEVSFDGGEVTSLDLSKLDQESLELWYDDVISELAKRGVLVG